MIKRFPLLLLFFIFTNSCKPTKTSQGDIPSPKPITIDKEWTLEIAPNGLDNVGVIFGIDSNKDVNRIPGGVLELATLTSDVAVTQQKKTKDISVGALANFLAIKNFDSTANVSFHDTSHINATFILNAGKMTVIGNDTISAKFSAKKWLIEDNIKSLGLENYKLYLILETIKSPNVSIRFDKSKQSGTSLAAKFKSIIGISGHFSPSKSDSTDLVYTGSDTLTVFYKLRAINVHIAGDKGTGNEKISASLGNVVKADTKLEP